jgi:hypothetical protein
MLTKKLFLALTILILLFVDLARSQYDPPIGRTTYYLLRMWGEGDRPGADSVNRNLIDIDLYLHNINTRITSVETKTNDSLTVHRLVISSLRNEFDNVATIVSYLDDSSTVFSNSIKQLKDTLYNRVPRLSTSNAFTGNNSFTYFTIKDNGNNSLLTFNPAALHSSIIKSNSDTLLVAYENTNTAYGTWNFKNMMENNLTGHLVSSFGTTVETGLWVATEQNGQATTQLRAVPITINGVTVYILYFNPN